MAPDKEHHQHKDGNKLMYYILNGKKQFSWAGKMQTVSPFFPKGWCILAHGQLERSLGKP